MKAWQPVKNLEEELTELRESELWQTGKTVRSLRPENQPAVKKEANEPNKIASLLKKLADKPESVG